MTDETVPGPVPTTNPFMQPGSKPARKKKDIAKVKIKDPYIGFDVIRVPAAAESFSLGAGIDALAFAENTPPVAENTADQDLLVGYGVVKEGEYESPKAGKRFKYEWQRRRYEGK